MKTRGPLLVLVAGAGLALATMGPASGLFSQSVGLSGGAVTEARVLPTPTATPKATSTRPIEAASATPRPGETPSAIATTTSTPRTVVSPSATATRTPQATSTSVATSTRTPVAV